MLKKKPSVFANRISRNAGNNNRVFYSATDAVDKPNMFNSGKIVSKGNVTEEKRNINQKINDIFKSSNYVYKADVEIILKSGKIRKKIVGKNSLYLITMENELIPITDIVDIRCV